MFTFYSIVLNIISQIRNPEKLLDVLCFMIPHPRAHRSSRPNTPVAAIYWLDKAPSSAHACGIMDHPRPAEAATIHARAPFT